MKRRLTRPFAIVATAATALSVVLALLGPAQAAAPAPDRNAAKFEIDFLSDTIDHHEIAIRMAQICLDKAVHADLRALCQRNIDIQRREQQEMQSWLVDWYRFSPGSEAVQPNLTRGQERQLEKLASISDPAKFEITFMEMLIRHHRKGIRDAERCLDEAYHGELKGLCQEIITTQSQDIRQMEQWLCQWYGRCHRHPIP